MRLGRLRAGEWLALAGAVALIASLLVPTTLGPFFVVLLVVCLGLALSVAGAAATMPPARSVVPATIAAGTGTIISVVVLARVLAGQARTGTYVALVGVLAVAAGAWIAIRDERTDLAESAYQPPAPRPAPRGS